MLKHDISHAALAAAHSFARAPRTALLLGTALGCLAGFILTEAPPAHAAPPHDACGPLTRNTGPGVTGVSGDLGVSWRW